MTTDEMFKQFLKDMIDILKCPLSSVDKCAIVSEKHPNECCAGKSQGGK